MWEKKEFGYELNHGDVCATIEPRASYCNRGHWFAKVFGISSLDNADGFPRYYMSLDAAKKEIVEWLLWRLYEVPHPSHDEQVKMLREMAERRDERASTNG